MSSATTSCVMHLPNTRFFVKSEDILTIICHGSQAKCAAHRVLEVKTNGRFALWENDGNEGEPPEDFLWFLMDWDDFVKWSLNDRERTSFRMVIPQIEEDGYLLSRYVKVEEIEGRDGRRIRRVLCHAAGQPLTWQTYKAAAADHQVKGIIMTQYRYLYHEVNNKLIASMPPDPERPERKGTEASVAAVNMGQAAQEGVTSTTQPGCSVGGGNLDHTAAPRSHCSSTPCQNQQGGTDEGVVEIDKEAGMPVVNADNPPCQNQQPPLSEPTRPPCQNRQQESITIEESVKDNEGSPVAPVGAGGDVLVDSRFTEDGADAPPEALWTVEGILNQAAMYLTPLPAHIKQKQQNENNEKWMRAARRIHQSSYFAQIPEAYRPEELARLLGYLTDPTSPCAYRCYVEKKLAPRAFVPRLWHLADNLDCIAKDMDEHPAWQPQVNGYEGTQEPARSETDAGSGSADVPGVDVVAQFLWIGKILHYAATIAWQDKGPVHRVEFGANAWRQFANSHTKYWLGFCVRYLCQRHDVRLENMPTAMADGDTEPVMTPDVEVDVTLPAADAGGVTVSLSLSAYRKTPEPGNPGAPGLTYQAANALAERITREQNWQCSRLFEQGGLFLSVEFLPGQLATIADSDGYHELLEKLRQDPAWAEQERLRNERYAQFMAQCNRRHAA